MIHKIIPSLHYNQLFKRLDTQLNKPSNQNSIKVPKVVKPINKKMLLQEFFDLCSKQPNISSLNKPSNQNSIKVPKVVKPTNMKMLF